MCALPMEIKMAGWEVISSSATSLPTVYQLADMYGRINNISVEPINQKINRK